MRLSRPCALSLLLASLPLLMLMMPVVLVLVASQPRAPPFPRGVRAGLRADLADLPLLLLLLVVPVAGRSLLLILLLLFSQLMIVAL